MNIFFNLRHRKEEGKHLGARNSWELFLSLCLEGRDKGSELSQNSGQ